MVKNGATSVKSIGAIVPTAHALADKTPCLSDRERFEAEGKPLNWNADTSITEVVFRKWPSSQSIIALFPYEFEDQYELNCSSYEHHGQHGGADYSGCISRTAPASPAEYADLKAELESLGYNLKIISRKSR